MHRCQWVFPHKLPRLLVLARGLPVLFDGRLADDMELIGRQVGRNAE